MSQATSTKCASRWVTRIIPITITGTSGYATYVIVAYLGVDYLYRTRGEVGAAVSTITIYLFFYLLTIATYLRTFIKIKMDPGLVPLGPQAQHPSRELNKKRRRRKEGDLESQPYFTGPDQDPDSPGLEAFYSKDVFVCESDGRPKWCSECRNWKPDRAHHSSEVGRCVRKMDHYCPWVGGMVSETSFKFFAQFTFYCTLYCAIALAQAAYCLALQARDGTVDGRTISGVAIAAFFGLFTFLMTATSWRFIFLNITNIDALRKSWVHQLAIRVPNGTRPGNRYGTITYPLPNSSREVPIFSNATTDSETPRDRLATRTFAIVRTEPDENPWDLGYTRNWISVMGYSWLDWLLPIRGSPCANHESMESDYEMGSLIQTLRERYGLTDPDQPSREMEMQEMRSGGH
ncbi:DHHC zinc finger domain-containing protein [Colletotrichum navitas]|uniref:Palmitoyltransferase n=1 Tax=Colletotrichum navitas TaxID=681940 RepID=A0AAD8PUL8_9PEZI|nr:DHHC zinc finger domain-containing protein [Colletotrichum navitas]KAK1580333.1 DHHC zinc finger domain-containing protein [Colletotrichum navitas]